MSSKKEFDKYAILAEVVRALRDDTKEVLVETIGAKQTGPKSFLIEKKPQIPTKKEKFFVGGASDNRQFAQSIKIGKDISIKRIRHEPTPVKTEKQEYLVDNGHYYVVRTPMGEAQFDDNDSDFLTAWNVALQKYDDTYSYGRHTFINKEVNDVYRGPGKLQDSDVRAKYDKAIQQLKDLGIEPDMLAQYVANKKQND